MSDLAKKFHDCYEKLAPQFGYETREDTKEFDPNSSNGKLMIAVCQEIAGNRIEELEKKLLANTLRELADMAWISAKERLPQKYQQVIACGTWVGEICGAKEKHFIGMGEWDGSVVNMECDTYGCAIVDITDWMPRPDRPKRKRL